MLNTVFGTKAYQDQTWTKSGLRLPVTIINTYPMTVMQIKTDKTDGYQAIQVSFGEKKLKNINKPIRGHLKKAKPNLAPRFLREIRTKKAPDFKLGDTFQPTDILKTGDLVKVTGTSKGKGFTGVVKRWGFKGGQRTHGQSDRQRAPGSIGQGTDPGRVHKGKKMPGRAGGQTVTVKNLKVIKVDPEAKQIWISGQVPGPRNSLLTITKASQEDKHAN